MKALAQQNIHWGKGHSMIAQLTESLNRYAKEFGEIFDIR